MLQGSHIQSVNLPSGFLNWHGCHLLKMGKGVWFICLFFGGVGTLFVLTVWNLAGLVNSTQFNHGEFQTNLMENPPKAA